MEAERGWSTLSQTAYQSLEVNTHVRTLTDILKQVEVETLGFTLTKKKAKALINALVNSQREVDVATLSNTLAEV